MDRFSPSERRTLGLATGLVLLASAARILLAPDPAEYAWRPSSAARGPTSVDEVRRAVGDTLAKEAEASRPLAPGETIDVNRADAVQLQRLPGVGAARAAAILHERSVGGPYRGPDDLARVPGVGPGLVERWSGLVEASPVAPSRRPTRPAPGIDLNRAHPKELEQITGIGPALARRIVEARARRGPFRSVDDLLEVPGIGPKTLEKLRNQVFVR